MGKKSNSKNDFYDRKGGQDTLPLKEYLVHGVIYTGKILEKWIR